MIMIEEVIACQVRLRPVQRFGFGVWGFRSCALGLRFWVLGLGLWVLGFRFWVLGFGFW